jgi:hypothetical protein
VEFCQQATYCIGERGERVVEAPARSVTLFEEIRHGPKLHRRNMCERSGAEDAEALHALDFPSGTPADARTRCYGQYVRLRQGTPCGRKQARVRLCTVDARKNCVRVARDVTVDGFRAEHERWYLERPRTRDADVENRIGFPFGNGARRRRRSLHRPDAARESCGPVGACKLGLSCGDDEDHDRER